MYQTVNTGASEVTGRVVLEREPEAGACGAFSGHRRWARTPWETPRGVTALPRTWREQSITERPFPITGPWTEECHDWRTAGPACLWVQRQTQAPEKKVPSGAVGTAGTPLEDGRGGADTPPDTAGWNTRRLKAKKWNITHYCQFQELGIKRIVITTQDAVFHKET